MKEIVIYTDGACSGNPGPGGWGAILIYGQIEKELSAGYRLTTNNRMELMAVIEALKAVQQPCKITVHSDSRYIVDAVNQGWAESWRRNGWRRGKKKEPAKNPDLWEQVLNLLDGHDIEFVWVKGHADNEFNNRCDELAVQASQGDDLEVDRAFESAQS